MTNSSGDLSILKTQCSCRINQCCKSGTGLHFSTSSLCESVRTPAVTQGARAWSPCAETVQCIGVCNIALSLPRESSQLYSRMEPNDPTWSCRPNPDPREHFPVRTSIIFLKTCVVSISLGLPSSPCWVRVGPNGQVA
jgi:hypothetical protein